jgi:hypothetical protein
MIDLSILLPTRGRTAAVGRMLRSVLETAVHPERIELVLTADFDDAETRAFEHAGLAIQKVHGAPCYLGEAYRRCWAASRGKMLLLATDSLVFATFGWDRIVRQTLGQFGDGIGLAWGLHRGSRRPTHLFLPRSLDSLAGGLGIEGYRGSHITAHVYDIFRQLNARGHERRCQLPDVRLDCADNRPVQDAQALRNQELDERNYLAWTEERRWLALELADAIEAAATPKAQRAAA